MRYEELFQKIDDIQLQLPKCALPVLLRLISKCIAGGTNEVEISARDLAAELRLSRDAIRVAALSLRRFLDVDVSAGVASKWILPADWFEAQRSLFVAASPVEKRGQWPGNQATTGRVTRPPLAEKPGHHWPGNQATVDETRPPWPGNQATVDEKPGHYGLETRPPTTQNQQLTDFRRQIRSDQIVSSDDQFGREIDQIVALTKIPPGFEEDAEIVSQHLRAWYARHGIEGWAPPGPPQSMLAPTLALAPLQTLLERLQEIKLPKDGPPRKWRWFFVSLANQITGLDAAVIVEAMKRSQQRKPPQSTTDTFFKHQTLQHITANARTMR